MTAPRRGFTLMELLVVIAIIAILIGLLLPNLRRVREASARAQCQNNLKQILLGLHNYHDTHGRLPPGCVGPPTADPAERLSWVTLLLPSVEQDAAFRKLDPEAGYAGNATLAEPIRLFRCPAARAIEPPAPLTHYFGCGGVGADAPGRSADSPGIGLLGFDRQLRLSDVKDGTSNTLALLESHDQSGPWAQGGFATLRGIEPTARASTHEGGGSTVGMADGSVRFVREKTPFAALAAAATVAGGEAVALD